MEGKEKVDNLVDILDNLSLEKDRSDQHHQSQHKLQFSNDFLTPISVKSSKWSHNKVNIHNIKMQKGPFDKYFSKHIILPPSNPLPILTHTVNIEDSITDESDQIRAHELISELLKPKEYPKTPIDPKDRIIDNLKVELFDHQVLGLKFMLHREKVKTESRIYLKDIYGICENNEDETIFNNGGILADDMGLGKTIQIIALILSNQTKKSKNQVNLNKLKSTLIVCPASLVSQWHHHYPFYYIMDLKEQMNLNFYILMMLL
jgi:SNF2 family DNA or RNA helicase